MSNEEVPVFAISVKTQGKSVPDGGNSKCKGLEVGRCLACSKDQRQVWYLEQSEQGGG